MENKIYFNDVLNYYNIIEKDAHLFALKLDLLLEYSIARGEGDSFRNEIRENWPIFLNEFQYDDIIIRYIEHKFLYVKLAFGKQFHLIKKDHFLLFLLTSVAVKLQINETNDNLLSTLKSYANERGYSLREYLRFKLSPKEHQRERQKKKEYQERMKSFYEKVPEITQNVRPWVTPTQSFSTFNLEEYEYAEKQSPLRTLLQEFGVPILGMAMADLFFILFFLGLTSVGS